MRSRWRTSWPLRVRRHNDKHRPVDLCDRREDLRDGDARAEDGVEVLRADRVEVEDGEVAEGARQDKPVDERRDGEPPEELAEGSDLDFEVKRELDGNGGEAHQRVENRPIDRRDDHLQKARDDDLADVICLHLPDKILQLLERSRHAGDGTEVGEEIEGRRLGPAVEFQERRVDIVAQQRQELLAPMVQCLLLRLRPRVEIRRQPAHGLGDDGHPIDVLLVVGQCCRRDDAQQCQQRLHKGVRRRFEELHLAQLRDELPVSVRARGPDRP